MISSNARTLLMASTMLAMGVLNTGSVQAAEGEQAEVGNIIVTARRVEERLQDVPISISVFNQDQLTKRNITSGNDLAIYTPSLTSNNTYGTDNTRFQIRGFVQELDTQPSVGVYFADVVAPRAGTNSVPAGDGAGPGSFFDLQNVQILKGPQGTLFGRNTTGGAILLVPQKPTYDFGGYVEGSIGNYNMRRLQGALNIPLGDQARMRIGADRQVRDGWLNNTSTVGPRDLADTDYIALRASLVVDLTPNLENYLIANYSKSDTNGSTLKLVECESNLAGFDPRVAVFSRLACGQLARSSSGFYDVMQPLSNPHSNVEKWQIINTTTWTASDNLTLKNIVSYGQFKQEFYQDLFGTDFLLTDIDPRLTPLGGFHFGYNDIGSLGGRDLTNQYTLTEEFQLQGRAFDSALTWQAGFYYELSDSLGPSGTQAPGLMSCADYASFQCSDPLSSLTGGVSTVGVMNTDRARIRYRDTAVYAQATYSITDRLKVTGGFRYTWDKITNNTQQITYTVLPAPAAGIRTAQCFNFMADANCVMHYETSSSAPTWVVDLAYSPSDNFMAYAKYARGYKAASIAANIPEPAVNYTKPEKVDVYEVGFKSTFTGAIKGNLNISAFYNDFTNQQLQVSFQPRIPTLPRAASAINAGQSEIYGAEVEASINPFRGLYLTGSYTYLKTKIKAVPDFSAINNSQYIIAPQFRVGDPLALSPKNKFTVSANYHLPIPESVGDISFGLIYTYTGKMLSNYNSRSSASAALRKWSYLESRDLLNLNVNWDSVMGSPIDLSFFATNLTKEKYYVFTPGLALGVPFEAAGLGEPRMYGLRLKYRFGG